MRKARRSRRRKSPSKKRAHRRVRTVHNPSHSYAKKAHRRVRRRRNPGGKVGAGQVVAGALGAIGGIIGLGFVLPRIIDKDKNPYLYLGSGVALAAVGGMAVGKMNMAAGLGVASGGIAALATPYIAAMVAPALPSAPTTTAGYLYPSGAVEIPTGAVEIPMGAVEIPSAGIYDVNGDGMVAIDDGYSYDD